MAKPTQAAMNERYQEVHGDIQMLMSMISDAVDKHQQDTGEQAHYGLVGDLLAMRTQLRDATAFITQLETEEVDEILEAARA